MRANAPRPGARRRRVCAVALGLGLLLVVRAANAASVVSSITVGRDEQALVVDIATSGALGYLLSEGHGPFALSLIFTDASFAFAATRRTFEGDGLVELQAQTLTREGSTIARLDLTFAREAPYAITRERSRMRIRVELPGPQPAIVIDAPGAPKPAPASAPMPSAPTRPPAASPSPPAPADRTSAVLRAVHPESSERGARLALDVDGAAAVKALTLDHPARVIVDLEDTRVEPKTRTIAVGGGLLRRVRISQRTVTAVRIVCDLARSAPFRVEPTPHGLILHLGEGMR